MLLLKQILIAGLFILVFTNLSAQTEKKEVTLAGIYLTVDDFKTDKITYEIDCSKEKQKIKLHDFFTKPYIDVYHKGVKHTLQKKDVFGYIDCQHNKFRFFNHLEYQIAESGHINIYFLEENVLVGKGTRIGKVYYFSPKPNGEIKPLTVINLKYAFPDNHKFHDALDKAFDGSVEVSAYDIFHKTYKVNHVYEMSLK